MTMSMKEKIENVRRKLDEIIRSAMLARLALDVVHETNARGAEAVGTVERYILDVFADGRSAMIALEVVDAGRVGEYTAERKEGGA